MMTILETTRQLASLTHNEHLMSAHASGRRIIGYFCAYIPEEIIHAAGCIPYRMRAAQSTGTTLGDTWFSSINCTFVRHVFDKVLRHDFDFLDGVVFMNGCDHLRRVYDNWRFAGVSTPFLHMFITPHVINDNARSQYRRECLKFKEALEKHLGTVITDQALQASIRLYNRKRALLQEIYELRKGITIPIKGSEMLALMLAVTAVPVEDAIEILQQILIEIKGRDASAPGDIRIFLAAGHMEEIDHLELLEECGATIAGDNLCMGLRHFDGQASVKGDVLGALAERYVGHISCPRMINDFQRRLDHAKATCRDYAIDAIILEKMKFCDLWGGEAFIWRNEFKKTGFPILVLERELYGGSTGQIRTRVQAFFEQVRNQQAHDDFVPAAGKDYRLK
ncbi:MAG TPA: 2-hydroxyacyl-CoA dehydratase family protein [Deltaproteobacteria bacterium]|nr:2-hydroxyacyl-CoA dehydratase family protein [Deltaproteobacteria bacterium]